MNKNIEYTDEIDVISELVSDISDRVVKNDLPELCARVPDEDVVKVVRCKDCKHSRTDDSDHDYYRCELTSGYAYFARHFCSQGERREDYVGVDAVIVRCKDCRWRYGSECLYFHRYYTFPDDSCSRGERREDAEE